MLTIPQPVRRAMQEHARAWYPSECCGLLLGDGEQVHEAACMDNLQDELHRKCPEDYPRDGRNGFQIDVRRMRSLLSEAEERGLTLLAIFHSHIDCGAYFSDEDKLMAAPFGEPNDPGLYHVVMDCQPGPTVRGAKAFKWDGNDFAAHAVDGFDEEAP